MRLNKKLWITGISLMLGAVSISGCVEKQPLENELPVVGFTYSPKENITVNMIMTFIDNSTDPDGQIVNWTWDFGDGNISYDENPTHKYASSGEYSVILTVMDNNNANSTTKPITFMVLINGNLLDMLIFLSPQYADDSEIKNAINRYIDAVKEDIGWDTKIVTVTPEINDFQKIDEIIEGYYETENIKACIMVGEDIDTALDGEISYQEAPRTLHWWTNSDYQTPPDGISNDTHPIPNNQTDYPEDNFQLYQMDICISLIYPTHSLDYQTRSSQIAFAFNKFSMNRNRIYPDDIIAFRGYHPLRQISEIFQTLDNYGALFYKENATDSEVQKSLNKSWMMYNVHGHSCPSSTLVGKGCFYADDLDNLDTPLFTAGGCLTNGWYVNSSLFGNDELDYSTDDPYGTEYHPSWYGSKILISPYLRAMVLGVPAQGLGPPSRPIIETKNFIINAMPDLAAGVTLAEAMIGHIYHEDDQIIYGDPTFHYNMEKK